MELLTRVNGGIIKKKGQEQKQGNLVLYIQVTLKMDKKKVNIYLIKIKT